MGLIRILRHICAPGWWARSIFRKRDLAAIAAKIAESETRHRGEIRVAIEAAMPLAALFQGEDCRTRAVELFHRLGIAQTRESNGVLIYIQLLDKQVEIVADEGINSLIPPDEWQAQCRHLEMAFAEGRYRIGLISVIERIGDLMTVRFPARQDNLNELSDWPRML